MFMAAQYPEMRLLIGGKWLPAETRETTAILNPANEEVLGRLPRANQADLDSALDAAERGFATWRAVSPYDRAKTLRKTADLLRERADAIGRVLTLEQGKPLAEAVGEVRSSADTFEWFAEEGRRAYGRVIPARTANLRQTVLREPVGPVALFTPWNFPAALPAKKIAAALAAGCSCIVKPSEETPGTAVLMAQALMDAGLPAGVLNLVFGDPRTISTYLIAAPAIRKISFTGSTGVGKELARLAADGAKRATMELGGHAPVIVFDDIDVDRVAAMSVAGKFRNAGQVCTSPTRFFVHERIYERFATSFAEKAAQIRVGDGLLPDTRMGPCANERRLTAMEDLIRDARSKGATVTTGGTRIGNRGYFWKPTVLSEVSPDARIMNEEPFGPVAPLVPFSSFDDVVREANRLPFGLAAYAFTGSIDRAHDLTDAIETGMLGINTFEISKAETPFGGVKESGYGLEGGIEGLEPYLVTKAVHQARPV